MVEKHYFDRCTQIINDTNRYESIDSLFIKVDNILSSVAPIEF